MSMTKKDYIRFASLLKDYRKAYLGSKNLLDNLTLSMCSIFQADNPLFNRKRFLAACGYEE